MESIKKEANNPFFKSKYADLPSILAEIKDNLVKNNLSISHATLFVDGSLVMKTTVTETESGESESSIFPIFGGKPQEVGSSMTYARRYNIQALLDLSTEDDDGNSANDAPKIQKQQNYQNTNDSNKLHITDYIARMKETNDINELKTIFAEAITLFPSVKQVEWLTKEKDIVKNQISKSEPSYNHTK
jgi:hypothetical protein